MKSYLLTTALISLALLVAACQPAAELPDPAAEAAKQAEDVAAIKMLENDRVTAYNAGDAAGVAAFYTDDTIQMPPNEPAVIGKEEIQSAGQRIFDQFTAEMAFSIDEVQVASDWAFSRGTYTATLTPRAGGEPGNEGIGKGLDIYRRQPDGSSKIYLAIWNSDQPRPGVAE
ncbi:MAG: DUF4440 domain-containing protein [bacterium]|nr:DUF4440 domain-containing protein [bacterium]